MLLRTRQPRPANVVRRAGRRHFISASPLAAPSPLAGEGGVRGRAAWLRVATTALTRRAPRGDLSRKGRGERSTQRDAVAVAPIAGLRLAQSNFAPAASAGTTRLSAWSDWWPAWSPDGFGIKSGTPPCFCSALASRRLAALRCWRWPRTMQDLYAAPNTHRSAIIAPLAASVEQAM